MRTKIDILRAICFSKEDIKNIKNSEKAFTELEIEFMEEFKKIYEMGEQQLSIFIDKLDQEGKDLKVWDIKYYVEHLKNGPLAEKVSELVSNKKYFPLIPDMLGITGNPNITKNNTTIIDGDLPPYYINVDVFHKSPKFIQDIAIKSSRLVENVFKSSMHMITFYDNTLPLADKNPSARFTSEIKGDWVKKSNGSYGVKDSLYRVSMEPIRQKIFDAVKDFISEENFRIFKDNKMYNIFVDNKDISGVNEVDRTIDGVEKKLDIMGDPFVPTLPDQDPTKK